MLERPRDVTTLLLLLLLLLIILGLSTLRGVSADLEQRIVGGRDAEPGEFPHQIFLLWNVTFFVGGGSILTRDWVLTCGHCLQFPASEITVVSGTNSLVAGGNVHKSEKVIPHPGFVMDVPYPNDIGLIKVNPPFNLDGVLEGPVKLPAAGQIFPEGTAATVIGWGMLWENGDIPDKMQAADILVSNHDTCSAVYESLYNVTISDHQICAEVPEGGKGSCKGDSGGPLLVDHTVIGIVSWAQGCARQGYPTVYTNVASYVDWISDNMAANP